MIPGARKKADKEKKRKNTKRQDDPELENQGHIARQSIFR
jgi:hypothetical protein